MIEKKYRKGSKYLIVQLWYEDRTFAIAVASVITFYALLHVVQVEVYPLYLYAMYSQPLAQEAYDSYHIIDHNSGKKVDFRKYDLRHQIYYHNTMADYYKIKDNGYKHPETFLIKKVAKATKTERSTLIQRWLQPHQYDSIELEVKIDHWLTHHFGPHKRIARDRYHWQEDQLIKLNE